MGLSHNSLKSRRAEINEIIRRLNSVSESSEVLECESNVYEGSPHFGPLVCGCSVVKIASQSNIKSI